MPNNKKKVNKKKKNVKKFPENNAQTKYHTFQILTLLRHSKPIDFRYDIITKEPIKYPLYLLHNIVHTKRSSFCDLT